MCRLAVRYEPPGDSKGNRGYWKVRRLAVRLIPPGDVCKGSGILKRVALGGERGPARRWLQRQWVSRRLAPNGTRPAPSDMEAVAPAAS